MSELKKSYCGRMAKRRYGFRYNGRLKWVSTKNVDGSLIKSVIESSFRQLNDLRDYTLMLQVDTQRYWLDKKIGAHVSVDLSKRPLQRFYLVPPYSI